MDLLSDSKEVSPPGLGKELFKLSDDSFALCSRILGLDNLGTARFSEWTSFCTFPGDVKLNVATLALGFSLDR